MLNTCRDKSSSSCPPLPAVRTLAWKNLVPVAPGLSIRREPSPQPLGDRRKRLWEKYLETGSLACTQVVPLRHAGLWMPPQGEIDSSVLILIAQLQVLCTTLPGIRDFSVLIPNTGMKK